MFFQRFLTIKVKLVVKVVQSNKEHVSAFCHRVLCTL